MLVNPNTALVVAIRRPVTFAVTQLLLAPFRAPFSNPTWRGLAETWAAQLTASSAGVSVVSSVTFVPATEDATAGSFTVRTKTANGTRDLAQIDAAIRATIGLTDPITVSSIRLSTATSSTDAAQERVTIATQTEQANPSLAERVLGTLRTGGIVLAVGLVVVVAGVLISQRRKE